MTGVEKHSVTITPATLIALHQIGFKLVPLAEDGKTPNVTGLLTPEERQISVEQSSDGKEHPVNYIYHHPDLWNEERLVKEAWRFHNVATTFGKSHLKDEQGNDLFLNNLDIDSDEVFTRLANIRIKDKDYFFIDEMCQTTYVTKTMKKWGRHIFWLSHKPHPSIGTKDCKLSYEFEIKTDNSLGLGTLPPSIHRDNPNFHYQCIGQNTISIQDGLYDGVLKVLVDCLKTKNEKQQQTCDSNTCRENNKIDLTDKDIEQIVYEIKDFYQRQSRHNIVFGLAGYLYKNKIALKSAERLIISLCQTTNDEEKSSRITVLHNTYSNGQNGNKTIGYTQLLTVLTRISDAQTATQILDNISQVLKKYKGTTTNSVIEEATENIKNKYRFLAVEESKEILYYRDGVYVLGGDVLIEKEAEQLYGYELSNKHLTEIKGHIMRMTYHKHVEIDADINIINLKDGLYDIRAGKFKEHTPDYLSVNQKPIKYDPKARPKLFGKYLQQVLYPTEIRTVIELMAYTFCRDNIHEIVTILFGYGANGKSVFTGLLTALHGSKNVSNVPLSSMIKNTFALSDLENKDVNIDTELSSATIQDSAILKKLTGRQPIRIERKNQRAYDTILHAKLFFSANKIPQTADDSDAYYRRNVVISFPNKFEGDKADPDMLTKLTTDDEISGIFNVLMIALRNILLKNNGGIFINEKTIQARREKYEMAANPIGSFIKNAVAEDSIESDKVTKDEFYHVYQRYCTQNKLVVESKENLGKILKKKYQYQDGRDASGERRTIWKGVRLVVQSFSENSLGGVSTESVAA
jgi:putative DNA primase/helicase